MPEFHNRILSCWESLQACGIEGRTWLCSWAHLERNSSSHFWMLQVLPLYNGNNDKCLA